MMRTDPGHVPPLPDSASRGVVPPVWYPFVPRLVSRQADQDWRAAGRVDKELSAACRRGEFREYAPNRFRAVFRDGMLGVAFGHGMNLVDTGKRADPGLIYYFRDSNTTGCLVLSANNPDPELQRVLRERQASQAQGGR